MIAARRSIAALVVLFVLPLGLAWGETLELRLDPALPAGGPPVSVRTGVPLMPGKVTDEGNVRLLLDGKETDLQTEVMARFNDKSIKWLLLDFVTPPGAKPVLEYGPGVKRAAVAKAIKASEDAAGVTVDTGRLKAVIRKAGDGFPDELWLDLNGDGAYADDERIAAKEGERANWMDFIHTPGISSLDVLDASAIEGTLDRSKVEITELKLEVAGPLHAVVKVAGNYRYRDACSTVEYPYPNPQYRDLKPKDSKRIPFVMRLHFLRGEGSIEAQHTFIWEGDPDRDFPTSLALAAPMPSDGDVTIAGDAQPIAVEGMKDAKIGLSQTSADYYRVWKSQAGAPEGTVAEGRRAPGWMDVSNDKWGVTASVWRSWQNYPKGFHADFADGLLRTFLWPPEAGMMTFRRYAREWGVSETGARGGVDPFALSRHVSRGAAKTHSVLFDFHAGRRKAEAISARMAPFIQKVRAWPSLDHLCAFESLYGTAISPREEGKYDDLEKITDACFDWMLFNQDHFRWYGMLDYGDLQQCFQNVHATGRWENDYGRWGWFNGDASGYKPYSAMLMHFQRTGRRDIFDWLEAETLHVFDVDMVNCEEYPWNDEGWRDMRGTGHRHNAQHWACFFVGSRSARVEPFKHVYYFTGDERVRDALDIFAEQAWLELGVARASRGGHSGTQDMTSRLLYRVEHTGDEKVIALLNEKFNWVLNANRGVAPPDPNDDLEWARKPAEDALNVKRDYRYPGTVIPQLAGGIRYIREAEAQQRYREALDKAVDFMKGQFRGGPQGLPPDEWPGEKGGRMQGNWNAIPNFMPIAIHALKLHDAAQGGAK